MGAGWFIAAGTSAKDKNLIQPLVDGERAWKDVLSALSGAERTIHLVFWMMHLDHELVRTAANEFKDPRDREPFTLHSILLRKQREGVKIRILLWVLPTIPSTEADLLKLLSPGPTGLIRSLLVPPSVLLTLDLRILQLALLGKFEVILEPHPVAIGSWHQKTIIVDGTVAFVGGMNSRENDWDSSHAVYDYRRMPHASSGAKRRKLEAAKKEPEYPPRHDFQARIEGPLVRDVEDNFIERWNQAIKDKRFFSSRLSAIAKASLPSFGARGTRGQIVRTMPRYPGCPMGERGCHDTYLRAIHNAEKYIYIENQYFRSQSISVALASAAKKNRNLIIIVVTIPDFLAVHEESGIGIASPSSYWTSDALKILEKAIPDWHAFYLRVSDVDSGGDRIFVNVDTHAKIMIVDDKWYTIGSCNINDRGFSYEGEMNVSALDPERALQLRKQLFEEHLQQPCPDDIKKATKLWYEQARKNLDALQRKKNPPSRVFGFSQSGPLLPVVPRSWI